MLKITTRKHVFRALCIIVMAGCHRYAGAQRVLLHTRAYTVYADSIVQQAKYRARVLSRTEMVSDYRSPASRYKDAHISFKFSINGKDNELAAGTDHHFTCVVKDGSCVTPLIRFGTQLNEPAPPEPVYLAPKTGLTLRVDLGNVFQAFDSVGYYTTVKGDRLYKQDFKDVYVAGGTLPMIWDFDNLVNHPQLKMKEQGPGHIYEATFELNNPEDEKKTDGSWTLGRDIARFPQYHSDLAISDAIYNMSLEEMCKAVEADSTFRTGKEWAGVWTRDISYSIILSMAYLQPAVAMKSLLRKVNGKGRIIQDTGTGGAYPCSTDRMIWAVAAWEIYIATGDEDWLKKAYGIIRNSMEDDGAVVYDPETGLVRGESSFLDWREQTYPMWMQPADIFQSECLGTNAVHFRANQVLARMALILKDEATAQRHLALAERIRNGINHYLWMPGKGYYAQYLYGRRHLIISPRWESLGEALCICWDIADKARQKEIVRNAPMTAFGIPCIYPEIPGIPPYHNEAVWPFVETFWTWAVAKAGNEAAVMKGIGDIYRPAAMFVTNKENFVVGDGDFSGTQINSSNMLWSLSGNISLVHKVLFGIRFGREGLTFEPFVPRAMGGRRELQNFNYREATLDIVCEGYGSRVRRFVLDGKDLPAPVVSAALKGRHRVYIRLSGTADRPGPERMVPDVYSVATPDVKEEHRKLVWPPVKHAAVYRVLKNGKQAAKTRETGFVFSGDTVAEYQVVAEDSAGVSSFESEPLVVNTLNHTKFYQAEDFAPKAVYDYKGYTGEGFIELDERNNRVATLPVVIDTAGTYFIDFRYANGNGPINTENKCAIRTIKLDGLPVGTIVMPQRGKNEWSNWGYTNPVRLHLVKGAHIISLSFEKYDENMNGAINQAMLDGMRVMRMGE